MHYKNKSDFSHLTLLPGGNGDLRISCNMRTDASAVVRAGRKGGEGWGLVFCRWRYGCVCADGVLQLFLCQSVKALHHAVCRQTSLRVLIPAFCYSRTQELHALKHQTKNLRLRIEMSVTSSKKPVYSLYLICNIKYL